MMKVPLHFQMGFMVWGTSIHHRFSQASGEMPKEHRFVENPIFTAKQHERNIFTDQPLSLGWALSEWSPTEQTGLVAVSDQAHPSAPMGPSRARACSPQTQPPKCGMGCDTTYPAPATHPESTASSAPAAVQSSASWVYSQGKSCSQTTKLTKKYSIKTMKNHSERQTHFTQESLKRSPECLWEGYKLFFNFEQWD